MINILIPMAGKSSFFESEEYRFPKPFIEINNKSMIQLVIEYIDKIKEEKKFIFIINNEDCNKYHLDNVLALLTNNNCQIIKLEADTKGAACSALTAIEYINNKDKLLISNADQIIDCDINEILNHFEKRNIDGGVVCFNSIHPKWSYVRLDEKNKIIETAEKRPISKNAIAGLYYFKHGSDFVVSAMKSIKKDSSVNGMYFIAPIYNEMVLENKNLEIYQIKDEQYHTFYSPQKIKDYEKFISAK